MKSKKVSAPTPASERLEELLTRLADAKLNQTRVAARIGITPQHLSDLRHARRPMTELVARRLSEEFHTDYRWLLGQEQPKPGPEFSPSKILGGDTLLPLFGHPVEGEPRLHPRWDGTLVQVSGIAAPKLAIAVHPYVLRFGHDDVEGRIYKNDLVLISQSQKKAAAISVVRSGGKCSLARRKGNRWVRVAHRQALANPCVVTGHCLGILWSALS